MNTLILTLPHSGTNFLVRFLGAALGLDGINGVGNAEIGYAESGMACDFCHIHPSRESLDLMLPYKLEDHFDVAIVTRRHPKLILATEKRNNPNIDAGVLADQFNADWRTLGEEAAKYSTVLYLDITGPTENRLPQLTAIAEHFGKGHMVDAIEKYAAAWKPVNQTLTIEDMDAISEVTLEYEKWQS